MLKITSFLLKRVFVCCVLSSFLTLNAQIYNPVKFGIGLENLWTENDISYPLRTLSLFSSGQLKSFNDGGSVLLYDFNSDFDIKRGSYKDAEFGLVYRRLMSDDSVIYGMSGYFGGMIFPDGVTKSQVKAGFHRLSMGKQVYLNAYFPSDRFSGYVEDGIYKDAKLLKGLDMGLIVSFPVSLTAKIYSKFAYDYFFTEDDKDFHGPKFSLGLKQDMKRVTRFWNILGQYNYYYGTTISLGIKYNYNFSKIDYMGPRVMSLYAEDTSQERGFFVYTY